MSFMRGVIETTINNMSAEDRQSALKEVAASVVARMSPEERREMMQYVLTLLSDQPSEQGETPQ